MSGSVRPGLSQEVDRPSARSGRPVRRRRVPARVAVAFGVVALLGALLPAAGVSADALVTLSGVVSDASGAPVPGTTVSFNSEQAVSDPAGYYALHLPPDTTGQLSFTASSATAGPLSNLIAQQRQFATGSVDVVANLTWPAPAQARVSVIDETSTPMIGVVATEQDGRGGGELSDGTPISFTYQVPTENGSCTIDGTGHCLLPALTGLTPVFYSTYQPFPGNSSYPVFYAYQTSTVIDTDPTDITLQFVNVASFTSAGSVVGPVVVTAPAGTSFSGVKNELVAGNSLPSGAAVLTGALSYQVDGLTLGGSIDVTLQLPAGSNPTNVYKLQGGSYIDVSSIATIVGDTITLHLTDGGLGDADSSANGVIVDPVIPARSTVPGAPTIGQATGGNGSASVTFTATAKDGGSPILDYTASCTSSNGGAAGSATGGGSPVVVGGLTNGRSYACTATARNAVGPGAQSALSNSFTPATKLNQAIAFGPLANRTMAQSPLTVHATASSGLAVTFTTSTPSVCTAGGLHGATITLVGPGTCTVKADQPGNAIYNPAPTVSQSLRVR